MLYFADLPADF